MTRNNQKDKPFIIWTMQRTGGTNFTKNLIQMTGLSVHHEPFNRPREYGGLSAHWEEHRDTDELDLRIGEILDTPQIIKHCVEMVPWRISAVLAQEAAKRDYNHLFLVRGSSLQRLLSMEYARRTRVWGPSHQRPDEATDSAFDAPLDVEVLFKHEANGVNRLNKFWQMLKKNKKTPVSISFETIYDEPIDVAENKITAVLSRLLLTPDTPIEDLITLMRDKGNQKTRDRYGRFKGIEVLDKRLGELPAYNFV
jgi:LPS sulfotransferase NodH